MTEAPHFIPEPLDNPHLSPAENRRLDNLMNIMPAAAARRILGLKDSDLRPPVAPNPRPQRITEVRLEKARAIQTALESGNGVMGYLQLLENIEESRRLGLIE